MTTFHVQINGGPEQTIKVRTGKYKLAAMASLSLLDYEEHSDYDVVKIWVPELMPEYGPYFYAYDGHSIGYPTKDRQW